MPESVSTVMTQREATIPASMTANTPVGMSDVKVVAMPWWQILFIRAARVYLQTLTGLIGAAVTGADQGMLPDAFGALVWSTAGMALAPAAMSLLMNATELLTKLDVTRPTLRA